MHNPIGSSPTTSSSLRACGSGIRSSAILTMCIKEIKIKLEVQVYTAAAFNTNAGYRCKVVRIPVIEHQLPSFNFKVEIFSFESGVNGESQLYVSFTQEIDFFGSIPRLAILTTELMLYWGTNDNLIVIGFDPFMINSTSCM